MNNNTVTKRTIRNRARQGFTLIELISTTAVLIGLLLPQVQKAREASNRAQCESKLKQMAVRIHTQVAPRDPLPLKLAEAMKLAELPESGEFAGHKASSYSADERGWTMAVTPAESGVTGSVTLIAYGDRSGALRIESRPTPGASEGRARMFAKVRAHGAAMVAQLAELRPPGNTYEGFISTTLGTLNRPGAVGEAFRNLQGADGTATFNSFGNFYGGVSVGASDADSGGANFLFGDGSVRFITASFWRAAAHALQLGAYNEQRTLPGIGSPEVPGTVASPGDFFSFSTLSDLTTEFVTDAAGKYRLQSHIGDAIEAAARGNRAGVEAAMAAYRQAIDGLLTSTPPGISPLGAQTAYDQSKWIELQSMQIFPPRNL